MNEGLRTSMMVVVIIILITRLLQHLYGNRKCNNKIIDLAVDLSFMNIDSETRHPTKLVLFWQWLWVFTNNQNIGN